MSIDLISHYAADLNINLSKADKERLKYKIEMYKKAMSEEDLEIEIRSLLYNIKTDVNS